MKQDIKKVHLFTIIYITIPWYIDNDTIDSSSILRTNQCWGIYPTIHSFYFFPIAFLSNLKVRDIAFCLPKHFLFQNARVYRLITCVFIGLFSWTQALLLAKNSFSLCKVASYSAPGHRKDRDDFKACNGKLRVFLPPEVSHTHSRYSPSKSDLPNRKVGKNPLPSHHFSGDLLLVSNPGSGFIHRKNGPFCKFDLQ